MMTILKNKKIVTGCMVVAAFIMAIGSSLIYHKLFGNYDFYFISGINICRIFIFLSVYLLLGTIFLRGFNRTVDYILYHRYAFGIGIVAFGMILNLNGSSISSWGAYVAEVPNGMEGTVLGVPRMIRSDEWAVFTPMILSQGGGENAYQRESELIRACKTDISMHYGLPYYGVLTLFRPFLLGYLFFGTSYGLSFFWCARAVILILVSYEFGLLITEKKRYLSLIFALCMLLSPQVQWWFAINGLVELLISFMLSILLLNCMLHRVQWWKRMLCAIAILYCAGCFLMAVYPSWQVPVAYILLVLLVWVFLKNRQNYKFTFLRKDIPDTVIIRINIWEVVGFLALFILFGLVLFVSVYSSFSVIEAVRNTVYPGTRFENGGGRLANWFAGWIDMFFPYNVKGIPANVCEAAVMFDLFPAGLIFAWIVIIQEKKKDLLVILLLITNLFFSVWCIWGIPAALAGVTFLSQSQANRSFLAVGLTNLLLLIRALAIRKKMMRKRSSVLLALIMAFVVTLGAKYFYGTYGNAIYLIAIFLFATAVYYMLCRFPCKVSRFTLVPVLGIVLCIAGCFVNPIQRGLGILEHSALADAVKATNTKELGTWIFEGDTGWPMANYLLAQGVPVLNCVNTYPNTDFFENLDPKGEFEDVYNRYAAAVTVYVTKDTYRPRFFQIADDQFAVNIRPGELSKLEINYIVTTTNLELFDTSEDYFTMLSQPGQYMIFKVN